MERELNERLITAWVRLTGTLKNTRITQGMIYNEAILMNIAYRHYLEDGTGTVSFKQLVAETNMLKSLVNRTIDSLVAKNLLERIEGTDKRTTFVRLVPENIDAYLDVHDKTLALVDDLVKIIGEEDAEAFLRISEKISDTNPLK